MCACFRKLTVLIITTFHCYSHRKSCVCWAFVFSSVTPLLWLYYPECQHHSILWIKGATAPSCQNLYPLGTNGEKEAWMDRCFSLNCASASVEKPDKNRLLKTGIQAILFCEYVPCSYWCHSPLVLQIFLILLMVWQLANKENEETLQPDLTLS